MLAAGANQQNSDPGSKLGKKKKDPPSSRARSPVVMGSLKWTREGGTSGRTPRQAAQHHHQRASGQNRSKLTWTRQPSSTSGQQQALSPGSEPLWPSDEVASPVAVQPPAAKRQKLASNGEATTSSLQGSQNFTAPRHPVNGVSAVPNRPNFPKLGLSNGKSAAELTPVGQNQQQANLEPVNQHQVGSKHTLPSTSAYAASGNVEQDVLLSRCQQSPQLGQNPMSASQPCPVVHQNGQWSSRGSTIAEAAATDQPQDAPSATRHTEQPAHASQQQEQQPSSDSSQLGQKATVEQVQKQQRQLQAAEARAAQKQAELLALRKQLDEAQRRVAQKEVGPAAPYRWLPLTMPACL